MDKRRRADDDDDDDLAPTALKRARGADGAPIVRMSIPVARERAVHMTSGFDLEFFLVSSVRTELERRFAEHRPEDGVYSERIGCVVSDNYHDFAKRRRVEVTRQIIQSVVDAAAISCTGRALVAYLDRNYGETDNWISAFRRLYALVSDVENDIADRIGNAERQRQVRRILQARGDRRSPAGRAPTPHS